MGEYVLSVESRDRTGKGAARKLRQSGRIPGVCYGRTLAAVPVALDPVALEKLISRSDAGINTLIDLQMPGGGLDGKVVLVRELQRDPVKGHPLHADFFAVDLEEKIEVAVPIHLQGRARGVEFGGGIVDHSLRELDVKCFPRAIPREITIDVSELDIGDSLHVRDLALPEGVELMSDPDLSVVSVVAPAAEEVPEEAVPAEGEVPVEGEAAPEAAEGAAEKPESGESSDSD